MVDKTGTDSPTFEQAVACGDEADEVPHLVARPDPARVRANDIIRGPFGSVLPRSPVDCLPGFDLVTPPAEQTWRCRASAAFPQNGAARLQPELTRLFHDGRLVEVVDVINELVRIDVV